MFAARLSSDAQTALGLLAPVLPPETYLAGGSALALHLDHRQSYDLDLYTQKEFSVEQLASVADICAMKVEAISSRGKKRDFFDLFTICQKMKWSLTHAMELDVKKYGQRNDTLAHNLKSLTFFADADQESERIQLTDAEWKEIKNYFLLETPKAVDHFLK